MRVNATAGVGNHAGGTPLPPVGKPYYDPAWGRWLVRLGANHMRFATITEIAEQTRQNLAGGCRINRSTNSNKGE